MLTFVKDFAALTRQLPGRPTRQNGDLALLRMTRQV
jgi:hypothetical protein